MYISMLVLILVLTSTFCLILKNSFLLYFIALELFVLTINLQFIFSSVSLLESRGIFVAVILLVIAAIDTCHRFVLINKISKFNQSNIHSLHGALKVLVLNYRSFVVFCPMSYLSPVLKGKKALNVRFTVVQPYVNIMEKILINKTKT